MNALDKLGSALDRAIGLFAPGQEVKRRLHRKAADQLRYAAAKTTRLTGSWLPADQDVNSLIASSSPVIRARVRQLTRDFPYFAAAVNRLVVLHVGQGIPFQSRVRGTGGKLDKTIIDRIEDAFKRWADEADVAGKLHLNDMMRLAKRQDLEAGEFLVVKVRDRRPGRFLPLALQMVEADWLTDIGVNPNKNNKLSQGIEYDPQNGRVAAYHLADPEHYGQTKRIGARDVIHGFEVVRPGQLRGVSPFAPAVLLAHDLGDYMDAEIDAAKMAAKWLAFVETANPAGFQGVRTEISETGKKIEELENAIIEYLLPGEEVKLSSHKRPGDSFEPFVKLLLRMIAVTVGISYELLSGDYVGINYSNLRGIRNDVIQQTKPGFDRHVRQFCRPVFEAFMDEAVMNNKLDLPGYFRDRERYLRCAWIWPGMESPDPLRESKANIEQVKNGLRSPQEIAAARGRDLEEIYDEIAEAERLAEEKGLKFEKTSTALAQNPASLGASE
ncbi:MAG: phage portal protein [Deltaproteobacteria bacterium]|nr:phage portal protein [Deltaproteobacteria bacterium]